MKNIYNICLVCVSLLFFGCSQKSSNAELTEFSGEENNGRKKVLFVNSYHADFEWVEDITKGIVNTFNLSKLSDGTIDTASGKVNFRIFYMDTKRNTGVSFAQESALKAKIIIETWKPDLVIASDDNASRYLVAPYYKNNNVPFVFCGVNWDASEYGFPTSNITGMVEVTMLPELVDILRSEAKGGKIAFIAADSYSERKNIEYYKKVFSLNLRTEFAISVEDFKNKFVKLNESVDMIILGNIEPLLGFENRKVQEWISENTMVPTGAMDLFLSQFVIVTCAKSGEEQGEWAASTALKILNGARPDEIPMEQNKEVKVIINRRIAPHLDLTFDKTVESDA